MVQENPIKMVTTWGWAVALPHYSQSNVGKARINHPYFDGSRWFIQPIEMVKIGMVYSLDWFLLGCLTGFALYLIGKNTIVSRCSQCFHDFPIPQIYGGPPLVVHLL